MDELKQNFRLDLISTKFRTIGELTPILKYLDRAYDLGKTDQQRAYNEQLAMESRRAFKDLVLAEIIEYRKLNQRDPVASVEELLNLLEGRVNQLK